MRVLLTGSEGRVGRALTPALATFDLRATTRRDGDLCAPDTIARLVDDHKPDLIVHCAALTDVDAAERDPPRAMHVNAEVTGALGAAAARYGAGVVLISTDYVFRGDVPRPLTESDATAPISWYGCSKLEGEHQLFASGARAWVIRTSWLYDLGGNDFPSRILAQLARGQRIDVVHDRIGSPTSTDAFAQGLARIIDRLSRLDEHARARTTGVYHLASEGAASRYAFACEVAQAFGYDDARITAVPSGRATSDLIRPAYSALDSAKVAHTFDVRLDDWRTVLCRASSERPRATPSS